MFNKFELSKKRLILKSSSFLPKIALFFDLGPILRSPEILKDGIANINYVIKTMNGDYVIKVLLTEKVSNLKNEILIQDQLIKKGVQCPKYITNKDHKYLFQKKGVKAVASKLIPGIKVGKVITNTLCFNMGEVLAKFHTSVSKLDHPNKGWLNSTSINAKLVDQNKSDLLLSLIEMKNISKAVIYKSNLPKGIIHGDLYEGNILLNTEDLDTVSAIFDFEHSEENAFIIDIARTVLSIAEKEKRLESGLIESTLKGYESVRPLEVLEKELLPQAIKYVAGIGGCWLVLHGEVELARKYLSKGKSV